MKKKMGRPRKKKGVISPWAFTRAGIVMSAYDEARENGQKHSVAVRQSVEVIRQLHPKIPISETGVRRILSQFRPRKKSYHSSFQALNTYWGSPSEALLDSGSIGSFGPRERVRISGALKPLPAQVGCDISNDFW
jgi:hypothetical protein